MNKIVYNDCYGGFSLSREACKRLADQGVPCAVEALAYASDNFFHYSPYSISRHDPRLVKVVEDMGEDANGSCSELRVCEIEGNIYRIHNYEGKERILEAWDDWISIP